MVTEVANKVPAYNGTTISEAFLKGRVQAHLQRICPYWLHGILKTCCTLNIDSIDSETDYDSDPDEDVFTNEKAQECFDDFMVALSFNTRQMLAIALMENYKKRQGMNVKEAAQEAASFVGFHQTTIQKYRNDFFQNKGTFKERKQGKYERATVYHDENINSQARKWVRENAFNKGKPNMTAQSFCTYVNDFLLPFSFLPPKFPRQISLRTAQLYVGYTTLDSSHATIRKAYI